MVLSCFNVTKVVRSVFCHKLEKKDLSEGEIGLKALCLFSEKVKKQAI